MKKSKIILRSLFTIVIASVLFSSCIDDPEPVALDALPDVFIQKISDNGIEKYGIAFWVFGNKDLESATIDGPEGETWTLEQDAENTRIFSLFPEGADYTEVIPVAGEYEFTVTSTQVDEEPLSVSDDLDEDEIGILQIESTEFVSSQLKTTWQSVDGADVYLIRLYDDSDKMIYVGPQLNDDKTDFTFGNASEGWLYASILAEAGEPYTVEVLAILYESGVTTGKEYNIQCISIAKEDIIWGE